MEMSLILISMVVTAKGTAGCSSFEYRMGLCKPSALTLDHVPSIETSLLGTPKVQ